MPQAATTLRRFPMKKPDGHIEAVVDRYNHQRHHQSINNVTPAEVYFGHGKAILKQRERIKQKTLETRRLHHRMHAA